MAHAFAGEIPEIRPVPGRRPRGTPGTLTG
jgi:hypothetical protein